MIRGKLLSTGKVIAAAVFIAIVVCLIAYLRRTKGRASNQRPKLQGKLVGVFSNTHYAYEVDGRVRFILEAGVDKSYEDGHHDLEKVRLTSKGTDGTRNDVVTADTATVSDTSDLNKLGAEFTSNVQLQTAEGLTLKTSYLKFDRGLNTISTPAPVEFQRNNVSGKSIGMLAEANDERVHLLKSADVTVGPDSGPSLNPPAPAKNGGKKEGAATQRGPVKMKDPVHITGDSALLNKKKRQVAFDGHVVVTQKSGEVHADSLTGFLDASNRLEHMEGRGNCDLKEADRGEVQSRDMNFFFTGGKQLDHAAAMGGVYARSLGQGALREARADSAEMTFKPDAAGKNEPDKILAHGHAVLIAHPGSSQPAKSNPAERELKGNELALTFFDGGKDLREATADGDAVLTVTPTRADRKSDKKTIWAPHMRAEFFQEGGRIERYDAAGGVRVEIDSTVKDGHPARITTSDKLTATFQPDSQDVDRAVQDGHFKYLEGDRNGQADRAIYDGLNSVLMLRGSRPMGWDSKSRVQADEIDYDRDKNETHARGDVRTTYFDRDRAAGATPFNNKKAPIYVTADRSDEKGDDNLGIYAGNARAWQDDSFLKADRIEMYQDDKRMIATGQVDSALYTVERETTRGKKEIVPVFASSDKMTYTDQARLIHYEGHVRTRQGTDRLQADVVDAYLKQDSNDVDHVIATGQVDMAQPGRRGHGDKMTYTSDDGKAVLIGKDARIDDDESGSTMGSQLTFYNRDDRIQVDNQYGTGRVRSTHRMEKKAKEKR